MTSSAASGELSTALRCSSSGSFVFEVVISTALTIDYRDFPASITDAVVYPAPTHSPCS
ncbi:hypothetical protein [Mycolicibacterium fallax]|uniref:hypothetical protein n=1 Tax=Mycolicibacterium fallax TaxID=1793 RepID=UPI0021F33A6D|nr:hypothetical protein [Mycolicibacterium fallax]